MSTGYVNVFSWFVPAPTAATEDIEQYNFIAFSSDGRRDLPESEYRPVGSRGRSNEPAGGGDEHHHPAQRQRLENEYPGQHEVGTR